jgi:hypothetical protein
LWFKILDIWFLELVSYIVEIVLNYRKKGTGARGCSDAKLRKKIKI